MIERVIRHSKSSHRPLTGLIFDIRKYSIHDGPGIRTTIFMSGCPLSCWWCHNPEGQSIRPQLLYRESRCIACNTCALLCPLQAIARDGAVSIDREKCDRCGVCVENCYAEALQLSGRRYTVGQVMDQVERDAPFYEQSGGGVTFSGGEPLMQPAFLKALLIACKQRGYSTAVDTSGYAAWKHLDGMLLWVDLFLYDLKLVDERRHRQFTGVSNRRILANLNELLSRGRAVIVRMPVIPGINDGDEDIRRAGELLAALPTRPRVDLLSYHNIALEKYRSLGKIYRLTTTQPPDQEKMAHIAEVLRGYGLNVKI